MLPRSPNTIRILDLVFITKDIDGMVEAVDVEDHCDVALFHGVDREVGGSSAPMTLPTPPRSSRAARRPPLLICQDLWATLFVEALRASGAVLIEAPRIPHDLIEAGEAGLDAAG